MSKYIKITTALNVAIVYLYNQLHFPTNRHAHHQPPSCFASCFECFDAGFTRYQEERK
ncbi:hypothetical protein [Tychonema sp. LEGE 06208]|uniref:hypothetical protein n=1 Tax=Tychonema sp. LEGE 06208 TaxID=1828663 RepID=UPI00187EA7BB|nr:hypothetical protein [Tychonema sp. LEGE 06208]MBE9162622.1 hypothetical protein [Tychonema sp. LEGE 06208]